MPRPIPLLLASLLLLGVACAARAQVRPNIILCMTDDQGAADAGFRGHAALRTPNLDSLASRGMVLSNFYAQSPVCSPTRASCLTGLHPERLGITGANAGHMPDETVTLAELLRDNGYATGHFGKWHLGTLTTSVRDSNRGGLPEHDAHFAPPWEHGFDVCFSTEAKVPTADPMVHPVTGEPYGTRYWTGPGQVARDGLDGDDSRVIMDRVLPFVERCAAADRPFFAVVWFHAPHLPLVALPDHQAPYDGRPDSAYLGALAGVDAEMGRLWRTLSDAGISNDTLLFFCSDNGPERVGGQGVHELAASYPDHPCGSAAPYRGRKRSLHDGGLRTPAFAVWPGRIAAGSAGVGVTSTTDYLPTIADALGIEPPSDALDGVSMLPMLTGEDWQRPKPLMFVSGKQSAALDWPYKLIARDQDGPFALYNLRTDPTEHDDLLELEPEAAARLEAQLRAWLEAVRAESTRHTKESP